jgi:D-serine deaminase-like pyridoxal phosphate-dependent protein
VIEAPAVSSTLPLPLSESAVLPLEFDDPDLDTPALLIDLDVVEANIERFQALANREGFALRPHVKSHKSLAMAARQLDAGAAALCVASTSEAQVMAATSADDILVAYPLLGRRKLERLIGLAMEGRLTLVTDSTEVTAGYREFARSLGVVIRVLVEVDTGMNRAGVVPALVGKIATDVALGGGLEFIGIMTHAGHAHDVATQAEIATVARAEAATMGMVREDLEAQGFDVRVVSAGSTITSPYLRAGDGITEIRPGTYIYNDLRTVGAFAARPEEIAASMLTTVVSTNGTRVTIDAGSKTLTNSRDGVRGHGHLVGRPDSTFDRMSEEHGVLTVPESEGFLVVGERVRVLPIHICVWMDLQREVYGTRRGRVVERIAVDAMRHSL